MRYTNNEGNTLNHNEAMAAVSFLIEADVYICEPLEMYFNAEGELKAGKRPRAAVASLLLDE